MAKGYLEGLFSLEGKTLLFTGGSGVLGSALALGAARAGARIILLGRSSAKLEKAKKRIEKAGGEARVASCDVLDKGSLRAAYDELGGRVAPTRRPNYCRRGSGARSKYGAGVLRSL